MIGDKRYFRKTFCLQKVACKWYLVGAEIIDLSFIQKGLYSFKRGVDVPFFPKKKGNPLNQGQIDKGPS